jgi:hypothetical protein
MFAGTRKAVILRGYDEETVREMESRPNHLKRDGLLIAKNMTGLGNGNGIRGWWIFQMQSPVARCAFDRATQMSTEEGCPDITMDVW